MRPVHLGVNGWVQGASKAGLVPQSASDSPEENATGEYNKTKLNLRIAGVFIVVTKLSFNFIFEHWLWKV